MANERTMIITGKSQLSISPDMVRLSFKILTQETAYSQALDFLSDNANSLIEVLTSNGFKKDEIKTTRYSIHRWTRYQNGQELNLGYEGEHQLYVEFKIDNTRINEIINMFGKQIGDALFMSTAPETWFCDIETDVNEEEGFSSADDAKQ